VQKITNDGLGGTTVGALIGGLAGLPAGPLAATIGAAGGAIIGMSADVINRRADTEFVDRVSRELAPGRTAVVAEVADEGAIPLEALMAEIGGTVVRQEHAEVEEQYNMPGVHPGITANDD
jgi:uncharacterized membrane protein